MSELSDNSKQAWVQGYFAGRREIMDMTIEALKGLDRDLDSNLEKAKQVDKAVDSLVKTTARRPFLGIF